MARWLLLGLCVAASACKIVTSTGDGDGDGGVTGRPVIGFASTNVPTSESAGSVTVELALSHPSSDPVTFTYSTTDGTALDGMDYTGARDTVTLDPGSSYFAIYIPILADTIDENDETFSVLVTNVSGATVGRGSAQVTIGGNQQPTINFLISNETQPEGAPDSFVLELSQPTSVPVSVSYVIDGSATPNLDYYVSGVPSQQMTTPLTPPLFTIAPGQAYGYLPITPYNDNIDEPDETIIVTLQSVSNAKIGTIFQETYTILDDDLPPTVSLPSSSFTYYEGTGGITTAWITVYLSAISITDVTVPFAIDTASSTATADDYTLMTTSPLVIPAGQTQATIMIDLTTDSVVEGNEYLTLQLGTPTNATLGTYPTTQVYILNDDCLGTGSYVLCPSTAVAGDISLPADFDTDSNALCAYNSGIGGACVVFAHSISIGTTVVHGYHPLVIAATQSIDIATRLDVTPQAGYYVPGMYSASCAGSSGGVQSGGSGGSFMTVGGGGGGHTNPADNGGMPGGVAAAPTYLRSGCGGYAGGASTMQGIPGRGGGAVLILAGTSITVHSGAVVNASGEPGAGSPDVSSGGTGGGAGGMIVFDAPTITATGSYIVANGAGGSEGGSSSAGGTKGSAPNPLTPLTPAPGGAATPGGNGGNGFAQGTAATAGAPGNNNNGGGGGGGGAGYIHTTTPLTGATVSPAPS